MACCPAGAVRNAFPRLVGPGWAKRLVLLGERIDAATASGIGLVEQVVAPGHAVDAALEWARQFHLAGPDASSACKRLIAQAPDLEIAEGLTQERALLLTPQAM